jgi:hypothetical protein
MMKLLVLYPKPFRFSNEQSLTLSLSLLAGFTRASLFPRQGEVACATASACVTFEEAADACSDNACFCPTAIAVGPACANCFGPYNASFSSEILSIVSECSQVGASTSTSSAAAAVTATTDPCLASNAACQTLYAAAETCADDACVCPTVWVYAPACAACYKTYNATVSSDLVQALSTCAEEGYTSVGAGGATLTSQSSGQTIALTTQTTGAQTTSTGGGAVVTVKVTASGTASGVSTATGKSSGSSREIVGLGILIMVFLGSAVTLFY